MTGRHTVRNHVEHTTGCIRHDPGQGVSSRTSLGAGTASTLTVAAQPDENRILVELEDGSTPAGHLLPGIAREFARPAPDQAESIN